MVERRTLRGSTTGGGVGRIKEKEVEGNEGRSPLTHAEKEQRVGKRDAEWEPGRVEESEESEKNEDGERDGSHRCDRTERDGG